MRKYMTAAFRFAELELYYQLFDSALMNCAAGNVTHLILNEPAAKEELNDDSDILNIIQLRRAE